MNMSARELSDEYLLDVVRGALQNAGYADPSRLKLELTESRCMDDPESAIEKMEVLGDLGIDVWIDDFGTGQSSLSYLKRLPSPILKIDKSFIDDLAGSQEDRDYMESIIAGIRARGKDVVAEGISSREQMEIMEGFGCSLMQGYYFSRPVPANLLTHYLAHRVTLPPESTTVA
jgi:EAL domain-containing protein (putative c-di-GMP-specific phosphodiesterase class I)